MVKIVSKSSPCRSTITRCAVTSHVGTCRKLVIKWETGAIYKLVDDTCRVAGRSVRCTGASNAILYSVVGHIRQCHVLSHRGVSFGLCFSLWAFNWPTPTGSKRQPYHAHVRLPNLEPHHSRPSLF